MPNETNGAQVTDIAIIVIVADDGVMPQTIEAMTMLDSKCSIDNRYEQTFAGADADKVCN